MCNDFEQKIAYQAYVNAIAFEGWAPPPVGGEFALQPLDHVRISDTCAVVVAEGETAVLQPMRWSFPPGRPGAGPVFNFRSEGRSFAASRRCLVPASAFYEFTPPEDPKQKRKDRWRFERVDQAPMALAGLWRPAEGNQPAVFTLLTCDAGPDIAPIHKRQIIPLEPGRRRAWLELSRPEAELLTPTPAGTLKVERG